MCFLTDSMCRGIRRYATDAKCWVHPGTTLERSKEQHVYHLRKVHGDTLVIIHIGTNNVASGVSPEVVLKRMQLLVQEFSEGFQHKLYFAVCAILPRAVDDVVRGIVKFCNVLIERWCGEMENMVFLRTWKAFVRNRKVWREMYSRDGLHLSWEGKMRLFAHFRHFVWRFCKATVQLPNVK